MRETPFGAALLEWLLTPITDALGVTSLAFLLTDTAALALVVAAFIVAFAATLALTRALAGGHRDATRRRTPRPCCRSPRAT